MPIKKTNKKKKGQKDRSTKRNIQNSLVSNNVKIGNSFIFRASPSLQREVKIFYDLEGVASGGAAKNGLTEPAWSYRIWAGSIRMSQYLVHQGYNFSGKIVLELGAGTGLVSIVSSFLNARLVISTDLPHALPLLRHNLIENCGQNYSNIFLSEKILHEDTPKVELPPFLQDSSSKCPASHPLTSYITDCEGYMCNICDDEIEDHIEIFRCSICNFDICKSCHHKSNYDEKNAPKNSISNTTDDSQSLPLWYRLQKDSQSSSFINTVTIPILKYEDVYNHSPSKSTVFNIDTTTTTTTTSTLDIHSNNIQSISPILLHTLTNTSGDNKDKCSSSSSSISNSRSNDKIISHGHTTSDNNNNKNNNILIHSYDWSEVDAPVILYSLVDHIFTNTTTDCSNRNIINNSTYNVEVDGDNNNFDFTHSNINNMNNNYPSIDYILLADVTYSSQAVTLLIESLQNLQKLLKGLQQLQLPVAALNRHNSGSRSTATSSDSTLSTPTTTSTDLHISPKVIMMHHIRSEETTALLWQLLESAGWMVTKVIYTPPTTSTEQPLTPPLSDFETVNQNMTLSEDALDEADLILVTFDLL